VTQPSSNPQSMPDARRIDVQDVSVGDLLARVSEDFSTLMRQEVALAKAEVTQEAADAGRGAGILGAAGVAGYMTLLFVSIALWWGLAEVMDEGLGALVVAVLWAIAAVLLYRLGRQRLRRVRAPEQTMQTLKDVPDALRGR